MKNYLLITLICLSLGCKKKSDTPADTTTPPVTNTTDWSGTYTRNSVTCSVPSYQDAAISTMSLPSTAAFTFQSTLLNAYLDTSVNCAIKTTTSAQISSDPMTKHDVADGYNSWDFLGGTISKSTNTLTFSYSFKIFNSNGTIKANPVYTVVYQK